VKASTITMTKKVTTPRKKRKHEAKQKMTKEERRLKYTQIAHQRRDAKAQRERAHHLTCFKCRRKGHLASSCPEASVDDNVCYKCGSTEHSLSSCPKVCKGERVVEMNLPFATCFICNEKGHLASQCQQNERGIYVNGGSCRTCGSTKHRATDCPEKKKSKQTKEEPNEEEEARANEALLHGQGDEQLERKEKATPKVVEPKKRRVVKF